MDLKIYVGTEHGAQTRLGRQLGCQPQLIYQWVNGVRPVPVGRCSAIERATDGAVSCEELRPDVRWGRLPDAAWPWHPEGRPLLDVSAPANPPAEAANAAA
jgi:DNA-binding transcriptional regulator YdaS (Cro superfamily)